MLALNPRHGTHDPRTTTPSRRPGSVRRTTSVDMLRPEGVLGPLLLVGRGRDVLTRDDGTAEVVATGWVELEVAFLDGRRVTAARTDDPAVPLESLVGVPASSGFRARLEDLLSDERRAGTLRYQLLDDVPVTTLVSGYAVGAAGVLDAAPRAGHVWTPDLCAGWRSGGTIMVEIDTGGRPPNVTGPEEPDVWTGDDPFAWHELPALPAHGMRRLRRTDVWTDDVQVHVSSWFRDSHADADLRRSVVHEYDVNLAAEQGSWRVFSASAAPRALPWLECPAAAGSAGRLEGRVLTDLRGEVRRDLTGVSTCTHLNDQLRSLADVPALAARLAAGHDDAPTPRS